MENNSIVLIDAGRRIHNSGLSLAEADTGIPRTSLSMQRLSGGKRDGIEWLEVDNGKLRTVLLPNRGMGIWKAWLGGLEIGWKSPVRGPVHPSFVPIADSSGLGWLEGFDELLCRCGLASNGAPDFNDKGQLVWPLHGRIANLPTDRLEVDIDRDQQQISVRGVVTESRFLFRTLELTSTWITRAGESGFRIVDEVTNLSGVPSDMQILYHINIGEPFLEPGSIVAAPMKAIAPRDDQAAGSLDHWETFPAPTPGFAEQVYFFELQPGSDGRTSVLLRNANRTRGISITYPVTQLPYFVLWKNAAASQDGYVCGLEPAINFPNPRSFEERHGRVRKLLPGETVRFELQVEIHDEPSKVESAEQAIRRLQSPITSTIHRSRRPDWSK